MILALGSPSPRAADTSSEILWLQSTNGHDRGIVFHAQLNKAQELDFELWGPSPGHPLLQPLNQLPAPPDRRPLFACNGGFWNENQQSVGTCSGERGIHASLSHRWGLALDQQRIWIGALTTQARLEAVTSDSQTMVAPSLAINPYPCPTKKAFVLDRAAWPWSTMTGPARPFWILEPEQNEPLRFNTTRGFTVAAPGNPLPSPGQLLYFPPVGSPDQLAAGQTVRLSLELKPLGKPVTLSTSAGPILVREGEAVRHLQTSRRWRTAVGCNADGNELWIVALSRGNDGLSGVTLGETAQTLKELGAWQAINLDGGSSTCVWIPGQEPRTQALFPYAAPIHHGLYVYMTQPE